MSQRIVLLLKVLLFLLLMVAMIQWIFPMMNSPEFELFVTKIGIFGPLVIILFTVISHVLAPVAGSPMVIVGFTVYGVVQTSIFLYIASMISAVINFEISRRFGRKVVRRLVGKEAIEQIDKIAMISGGRILSLGRLFGFPIFEIISYAAGLTRISFKKYMSITVLLGAIPNLLMAIFLSNSDIANPTNFYIWLAALMLVGFGFSLTMKEYVDRRFNQSINK